MKNQIIFNKVLFELDDSDLLACRTINNSWKLLIDDPVIWLKKLRLIGQPISTNCEWKKLIQRCIQLQEPIKILTPCLMKQYFTNVNLTEKRHGKGTEESKNKWRNVWLRYPPINCAVSLGQLDVVKLICNFDSDYNRRFSCEPASSNFFYVPLLTAIIKGFSDIVQLMVTKNEVIIN